MGKIDHPSHYNLPGKKECIEQMLENYGAYVTMVFCVTNAYKYLYRMGAKDGETAEDDLGKARWYANRFKKLNQDFSIPLIGGEHRLWLDVEKELGKHDKC